MKHKRLKIISGGQTGVDRAGLDMAIKLGIEHGGWCPKGRLAEDGAIPDRYQLDETPTSKYAQRTQWNVRDSDGTLIITQEGTLGEGTQLTIEKAIEYKKPYFILEIDKPEDVHHATDWIKDNKIRILNIAGPRASQSAGIYLQAFKVLEQLLCL